MSKRSMHWHLNRMARVWQRLKATLYYRFIFGSFGRGSRLAAQGSLHEPRFMHIGEDVVIGYGARLEVHSTERHPAPVLRMEDHVSIEQNVHITCHNRIVIGRNVTIAGHCVITDITHPFDGMPQSHKVLSIQDDDKAVEIGEGTFLGMYSIVLPGVTIGSHCVIGAGSIVTRDVPAFSVVAGAPAKVIRSIQRPPG